MNHQKIFGLCASVCVTVLAFASGVAPSSARAAEKIITVGTGALTGVYYPAGGAICRLVNRGRKEHGIRCTVESTGGSVTNLDDLRSGDMQLAVVQSDALYHAYQGDEMFTDLGPNKKLRALFAMYPESFTVVARKDSKINAFDDLKGKRVSIGNQGSGMRATAEDLMRKKGWTTKSFAQLVDLKANEQAQALCSNQIDAMIYSVGHPNAAIQQVTSQCPVKLVSVQGTAVDELVRSQPFYTLATIPGGMYAGNPQDTRTFGVRAVLATTEDLDEEAGYRVVSAVFENLENFKTLHPVFATLDAKRMVEAASFIPLHPGAERYFREKGWLNGEAKTEPKP